MRLSLNAVTLLPHYTEVVDLLDGILKERRQMGTPETTLWYWVDAITLEVAITGACPEALGDSGVS